MTAKELRAQFELDLHDLQEACTHEHSEWMQSEFAPGHTVGSVKVCTNCEKVIEASSEGGLP